MTDRDDTEETQNLSALLAARQSERDSASFALSAAATAVEDTTELLDTANAELRRIEARINDLRLAGEPSEALEDEAHEARDTVAECEVAVHEAQRVIDEYRDEVVRLEGIVRGVEARLSDAGE